jgi:pimeloyl-ACP methyl ester carboxylesterase
MAFAELENLRLFYTDDRPAEPATAQNVPLLLVHGWGADSHEWAWHLPQLSAGRRVIAADLRGHGYSSAPESGFHPRDMAADLVRLLDHLGIESVIPIGHSMGAQIVSILAVEHPARVPALVCVEPGYGITAAVAGAFPQMVRALHGAHANEAAVKIDEWSYTPATPPLIRLWHARRLLAMRPHVLADSFAGMFTDPDQIGVRPAADEYLARRACPVLSLWADPAQAAWEQGLFKHPASTAISWPGSGHRLHEERPAEFLLVVTNWLDKLDLV